MIDCELRVVDPETGSEAPPGVPGELLVRGYTVMDGYKIPRHVIFVDAFPMTPSGKIRKVELRAEARRQLG